MVGVRCVSFDVAHPIWIVVLPLALVWIVWLAATSNAQLPAWRRGLATALRGLILSAILLALAGLQALLPVEHMTIFFLLDRSESVPTSQETTAHEWIQRVTSQKRAQDRAGLIVFGKTPAIHARASPAPYLNTLHTIVPTDRTDIGAAIQLATAAFPETGQRRIVLLSDGNENLGDASATAIATAAALNASIDVLPLEPLQGGDVAIQRVHIPSTVRIDQPFEVMVFVHADEPGPAIFRLHRNEQAQGEQTIHLEAGRNLLAFPQRLGNPGFYTYDVRLEAEHDSIPHNNRGLAFIQIHGSPRILIASNDPQADAPLASALESPAIELQLLPVHRFPETLAELQSYDTIVLANVSAGDLPYETLQLLESAVRDFGVGVVCVGGDRTYSAGGYSHTPLESLLPVHMDVSGRKVLPSGALLLVIDKSGSMSGEPIETARQAAIGAVQLLSDRDYVGVVAFDAAPQIIVDMQPASNRNSIIRQIAGITAGGGTVMQPAMEYALALLQSAPATLKHCVILTDGISAPGDFEAIAQSMAHNRITVSTIGLGTDIDAPLLERIALIGQGQFHFVPSPSQIPQIFIQETALMLGTAIVEEPFHPQPAVPTEPLRGFFPALFPQLSGYVATDPKPRAEIPLLTHRGDPLLAHWQYGLGRTVAFTSDSRAGWASDWLAWDRFQTFWRQIVHWSLRRQDRANFVVETRIDRGQGTIGVVAIDASGRYRDFLELQAALARPEEPTEILNLRQTGPGHYQTEFSADTPGFYLANIMLLEQGQIVASQITGAALGYSPEFEAREPNLRLLHELATLTGGKILDPQSAASNPFHRDRQRTWQPFDLWPWLLQVAILLFVLDVAVRRIQLDPDELKRAWTYLLCHLPFIHASPEPARSSASLAALLARRDQVRSTHLNPPGPDRNASSIPQPPVAPTASRHQPAMYAPGPPTNPPAPQSPTEPGSTASRLLEARRHAQRRAR
jgi:Ca-activated chloride channel homolog